MGGSGGIRRVIVALLAGISMLVWTAAAEATFPGQNGKIAFSNGQCLYTMNADGSARTPILPCGDQATEQKPRWRPEGTRLGYEGYYGQIDVVDADGSNLESFYYDTGIGTTGYGWSPTGSLVVAWQEQSGCGPCYTALEIPTQRILQSTEDRFSDPDWSPDGNWIAFASLQQGVTLVHPDGTGETPLASGSNPSWSPDAQRIAYTAGAGVDTDIYVMDADGSNQTPLTSTPESDSRPRWSPDGSKILFIRRLGPLSSSTWELYVMNADGTGQTSLTPGEPGTFQTLAYESSGDWQSIPINAYPRPKGATPFLTYLVPAYDACASPNRQHGPPLAFASCNPPTQSSTELTVGSADSNGKPTKSVSSVRFDTVVGNPSIPGDQADVKITAQVIDVYTQAGLADYAGELTASTPLRITDKLNTPHPGGPGAGTVSDIPYGFTIPCAETADTAIGGACLLSTSADALAPGAVSETKRSIWALGQVVVDDANGDPFMKQGIFVP